MVTNAHFKHILNLTEIGAKWLCNRESTFLLDLSYVASKDMGTSQVKALLLHVLRIKNCHLETWKLTKIETMERYFLCAGDFRLIFGISRLCLIKHRHSNCGVLHMSFLKWVSRRESSEMCQARVETPV